MKISNYGVFPNENLKLWGFKWNLQIMGFSFGKCLIMGFQLENGQIMGFSKWNRELWGFGRVFEDPNGVWVLQEGPAGGARRAAVRHQAADPGAGRECKQAYAKFLYDEDEQRRRQLHRPATFLTKLSHEVRFMTFWTTSPRKCSPSSFFANGVQWSGQLWGFPRIGELWGFANEIGNYGVLQMKFANYGVLAFGNDCKLWGFWQFANKIRELRGFCQFANKIRELWGFCQFANEIPELWGFGLLSKWNSRIMGFLPICKWNSRIMGFLQTHIASCTWSVHESENYAAKCQLEATEVPSEEYERGVEFGWRRRQEAGPSRDEEAVETVPTPGSIGIGNYGVFPNENPIIFGFYLEKSRFFKFISNSKAFLNFETIIALVQFYLRLNYGVSPNENPIIFLFIRKNLNFSKLWGFLQIKSNLQMKKPHNSISFGKNPIISQNLAIFWRKKVRFLPFFEVQNFWGSGALEWFWARGSRDLGEISLNICSKLLLEPGNPENFGSTFFDKFWTYYPLICDFGHFRGQKFLGFPAFL